MEGVIISFCEHLERLGHDRNATLESLLFASQFLTAENGNARQAETYLNLLQTAQDDFRAAMGEILQLV